MKILVTGRAIAHQPDRCTGQQLQQGFIQAGHECVFYGSVYGQPINFLGVEKTLNTDFDLVVVTECNDGMSGYQPLFNHHKLKDVPLVFWDFDISYHPEVSMQRATSYNPDGYLVANRFFLGDSGFGRTGKPVLFLPYACSPQIHRRMPEVRKETLVGFIGSLTAERKELFKKIDIKHVDGAYGDDLIVETNKLYCMLHKNQDACRGLIPGRPLESAGCGTPLLMDSASYEDFIDIISPKYHNCLLVYDDEDDIKDFVSEWDNKNMKRALVEMGQKLMAYVHTNHTYKNRAETIVAWAKAHSIL